MRHARLTVAGLLAFGASALQALTLGEAFEAGQVHDATFQAARAELDAARQLLPIARAARLPSLSATASEARVEGSRTVAGLSGPARSSLDYSSPQHALSLRIPVLDVEALLRERVARAQVEQAERVFELRRMELLDRAAQALLNLRRAEWLAALVEQHVVSTLVLAEQARSRLADGEGTRSELAEAESAVALARVAQREASSGVSIARLALGQLMGPSVPRVAAATPQPPGLAAAQLAAAADDLPALMELARSRHPALWARRLAVEAAAAALRRNEAGHLPRADVVLSASTSRNDSLSTLNQTVNQRVVRAQLSLPLYSGGAVTASVAQAAAELRKAEAELSAEEQLLERELGRLMLAQRDLRARVRAQEQAVEAARTLLRGTVLAREADLASRGDESQARRRLVQEQQALVDALHQWSLAWIRLLLQSGDPPLLVAHAFDVQSGLRALQAADEPRK